MECFLWNCKIRKRVRILNTHFFQVQPCNFWPCGLHFFIISPKNRISGLACTTFAIRIFAILTVEENGALNTTIAKRHFITLI